MKADEIAEIYDAKDYYDHGLALLDLNADYYPMFKSWALGNDKFLKQTYINLVLDDKELEQPYLSWAMSMYVRYDYNKVRAEISDMAK